MSKQTLKFLINTKGQIQFIYSDDVASLLKEGEASITRVSNVEPTSDGFWQATMMDGTKLGKHKLRAQALAEEVSYIETRMFKNEASSEKA